MRIHSPKETCHQMAVKAHNHDVELNLIIGSTELACRCTNLNWVNKIH